MPYSQYTYIKAIVNTNVTITETIYIVIIIIINLLLYGDQLNFVWKCTVNM